MIEEIKIKLKNKDKILNGIIYLCQDDFEDIKIELSYKNEKIIKFSENCFEALIEIRKELENQKIQILCKGANKMVYPSSMQLNMGIGRSAYLLKIGEQAKVKDIVDIFEEEENIDKCVSIEEQMKFFKLWINSLRG